MKSSMKVSAKNINKIFNHLFELAKKEGYCFLCEKEVGYDNLVLIPYKGENTLVCEKCYKKVKLSK